MNVKNYLACIFQHRSHDPGPPKRIIRSRAERTVHYTPHGIRQGVILGRVVFQVRCSRCNRLLSEV